MRVYIHNAERPPLEHKHIQHRRNGNDWLHELKTHPTYLKIWRDRTTYVIALQALVMKDNEMRPLASPAISLADEGHGCGDHVVGNESECRTPKPLACTHRKVVLPAHIFQSEL